MTDMLKYFGRGLLAVVIPTTFCLIIALGFSALIAFVDQFDKNTMFTDTFRNMMKHGFIWVVSVCSSLGLTIMFFTKEE